MHMISSSDHRVVCLVQYVTECFSNSSLFHKALKEAFEQFCNKQVGGSSSAELMASFCDNLLKKVSSPLQPPYHASPAEGAYLCLHSWHQIKSELLLARH